MTTVLVVVIVPVVVVVAGTRHRFSVILLYLDTMMFGLTGGCGCLSGCRAAIESDSGLLHVSRTPNRRSASEKLTVFVTVFVAVWAFGVDVIVFVFFAVTVDTVVE